MGLATTVLRAATGATMAGHGLQKLTRSFGGGGLEEAGRSFEQLGFRPGKPYAMATGATEAVGGLLMVAGLCTPLACAMVSGVMASAISKVHYKNGFWAANKGFEPNVMLMASAFAIAGSGGGALSLDGLLGKRRQGFTWALAQLVVGVGTAAAVLKFSSRQAQPADGALSADGPRNDISAEAGTSEQGKVAERPGAGA
ncbi:MAG: DoxX family protein [Acidimicrobiales bacterium]